MFSDGLSWHLLACLSSEAPLPGTTLAAHLQLTKSPRICLSLIDAVLCAQGGYIMLLLLLLLAGVLLLHYLSQSASGETKVRSHYPAFGCPC